MPRLPLAALVLALSAPAAFAQVTGAQVTSAQRAACAPDVLRHCAGDIPNATRITACLKSKRAEISAGCRAVLDAAEAPVRTAAHP
ncbi:hypothetical protein MMB17_06150 [Methylobacterium organophilum]|uniref:hypothetical protein n=1 Tax=Methylobacterium organophilum TaxID=410 RepID=UPI001F135379|nr:hypothetical protein [Methylobacterium organophilum]UMY18884.1 hypothetical protein MMB17_06150 [Methylobacterium organophilum]